MKTLEEIYENYNNGGSGAGHGDKGTVHTYIPEYERLFKPYRNKKINILNIDAHADFRPLEGRHSGNGFSYAFREGFIKKYYAYGLHENYISNYFLKQTNANKKPA